MGLFFRILLPLHHRGWVFEKFTLYKCDGDHKYEPEEDVMVPNET